jgi:putative salt-induced outer membrane protein YdiY
VTDYGYVILAPRAAITFRWNFSKDVRFSEELEFIPFLLAPTTGRLIMNNTTKLNARLTEFLSLTTAIVVNYDSTPPEGAGGLKRKDTDVALTVGLEATF